MNSKYFVSVDWGTTNFRLRLISRATLGVEEELYSAQGGIKKLFDGWVKSGGSRKTYFLKHLQSQMALLKKPVSPNTLVIISGMASSNIGLKNIPYTHVPLDLDGKNIRTTKLKANGHFKHDILLISGIKNNQDVVRGEETELLGLLPDGKTNSGRQLFIFPGTHSKHFVVQGRNIMNFRTYMTGEFFELLTNSGLLSASVAITKDIHSPAALRSFRQGVKDSENTNLLNAAFKVRTNTVFNKLSKENNFNYLSGLLIGTELQDLKKMTYEQICLASNSTMHRQYEIALKEIFGKGQKIEILDRKRVDSAVVKGQFKIMKYNFKKSD